MSGPTTAMIFRQLPQYWLSLCTRDMRVYTQANNGDVFHYRDKDGLESDMIIRLRDGRWAAVEVKLGSKEIETAAMHLLKLRDKINADKMGDPSFLMVVTGGQFAYRRKDGVLAVPVGCLRDWTGCRFTDDNVYCFLGGVITRFSLIPHLRSGNNSHHSGYQNTAPMGPSFHHNQCTNTH